MTKVVISPETVLVGIDKHLKSWSVTIHADGKFLKPMTMSGKAEALINHLGSKYPGRQVICCHEAGFCGFSGHRALVDAGYTSIMVNASDVSTSNKDKARKTDNRDSARLLQDLMSGRAEALHVPSLDQEATRDIVRHYRTISRVVVMWKNRIRSYLYKLGKESVFKELPHGNNPWTQANIEALLAVSLGNDILDKVLREKVSMLKLMVKLKKATRKDIIDLLGSQLVPVSLKVIPGLGDLGSCLVQQEIIDIRRFPSQEKLRSYAGLVPDERSSGERQVKGRITRRSNKPLKDMLIQAAWVATRRPGKLSELYVRLLASGMTKTKAIVRVAAKLLDMVYHTWHRALLGLPPAQDATAKIGSA